MIKIIQGDSCVRTVTVTKGADLVEEVYFTSKALNISQKLPKISDNEYLISIAPEVTINFKPMLTTFDITVILKDNQVDTNVYNEEIRVLKKGNRINGKN